MLTFREYLAYREDLTYSSAPPARKSPNLPANSGYKMKRLLKNLSGGKVKRGVFKPQISLNIPRAEMPQAKSKEDFINWVSEQGIGVRKVMVAPKDIVRDPITKKRRIGHAQAQMYPEKSLKMIKKGTTLDKPIILSSDGIIFDGNHHWLALMAIAPKEPVPMYMINLDFQKLKRLAVEKYPGVSFEESFDSEANIS